MIDPTDDTKYRGFSYGFIPHDNPEPTLKQLNDIFYGKMKEDDVTLKTFILYTQALETLYHEWKDYWIKVLTK